MIKASIVGASGYSGAEILRLLANHKEVEIVVATSNKHAKKHVSDVYPNLTVDIEYIPYNSDEIKIKSDVIFTALPHGISAGLVKDLYTGENKIIDISADFRLNNKVDYQKWYKLDHPAEALLSEAVYGLPEINKDKIKSANLVANPGCYPTSVILALAPMLKYQMAENIVINSLSGVSGAGAAANEATRFGTCHDNVTAYKVGGVHQHIGEIEQELKLINGSEVKVNFTPHLIPLSRGIYTTVVCDLKKDYTAKHLLNHFESFYQDDYFVNILKEGSYPELKAVVGSNFCQIGIEVNEEKNKAFIMCVIDNLVKGAAGQAVQNMNLMFGLEEWQSLESYGLYP